jgi:hypothetical protein
MAASGSTVGGRAAGGCSSEPAGRTADPPDAAESQAAVQGTAQQAFDPPGVAEPQAAV